MITEVDPDLSLTRAAVGDIGNGRVRRLLESALAQGLEVYQSQNVQLCWTIGKHRCSGESLTVYGEVNHAAHVSYDPGKGSALEVTRVRAFCIIREMSQSSADGTREAV